MSDNLEESGQPAPVISMLEQKAWKESTKQSTPRLLKRNAGGITSKDIQWLWPQRFALGKVSLIAGDAGQGKSQLTLDMAARISNGDAWPANDGQAPQGRVLLLSAEDSADDTVVPRLRAAGADLSRIEIIDAVYLPGQPVEKMFSLKRDIPLLEDEMHPDTKLLVIDPLTAFLSGTDDRGNSELRELLTPLSKLAEKTGIAIIGVTHLNKSSQQQAQHRVIGSIAFVAAARAAYAVVPDEDDPARKLFVPIKNNLGCDKYGFAYRIEEVNGAPRVAWENDLIDKTIITAMSGSSEVSALEDACEWLEDELRFGPVAVKEVKESSEDAGYSWRTIERAKRKLGVIAKKKGFKPTVWEWHLPDKTATEDRHSIYTTLADFDETPVNTGVEDSGDEEETF